MPTSLKAAARRGTIRARVSAGERRADVATSLGIRIETVRRHTRDLPVPSASQRGRDARARAEGRPLDDGIVDEVAVARALTFDPAALAVLRPLELEAVRAVLTEQSRRGLLEDHRYYDRWMQLPVETRGRLLNTGATAARRRRRVAA